MIRIVPWALCALACALPLRAEDAPASEVSKVDYYLREYESRVNFADGMAYEPSKDDKRALEEVKTIADKYPNDEKVKALVARGKAAYKMAKGIHVEFTDAMLAYRKRGDDLAALAKKAAESSWAALEKDLAGDAKTIKEAFPAPDPMKTKLEEMKGRRVVLKGVKSEAGLFVQYGLNWLSAGSATDGRYWVRAHGPSAERLLAAVARYRDSIKADLPAEWTIVAQVEDVHLLSPDSGQASLGWDVEPVAILVPGVAMFAADASRKDGAAFAGEVEVARAVAGSYSVTKVPEDVSPEQLLTIYITAVKEKNFDLHLDCIDPEARKHTEQIATLQYYWAVQQKGLTTLHTHAEPAEVEEIRVTKGGKDEGIDDFFDDEPKEKKDPPSKSLEERVTVKVRLFGPDGYQSAKPRFVTLIRRDKGRWYIYSGATLLF